MSHSGPISQKEDGLQILSQDGERVIYRGWRPGADGSGNSVLMVIAEVERNRDNPDGRPCAPPATRFDPSDTVFCFALGGAT